VVAQSFETLLAAGKKIYIYLHPCDRKSGEGAEDTKGLNERKTVVEG
jgi:hypothetical protein